MLVRVIVIVSEAKGHSTHASAAPLSTRTGRQSAKLLPSGPPTKLKFGLIVTGRGNLSMYFMNRMKHALLRRGRTTGDSASFHVPFKCQRVFTRGLNALRPSG